MGVAEINDIVEVFNRRETLHPFFRKEKTDKTLRRGSRGVCQALVFHILCQ
jgi:hypothetical protein